MANHSIDHQPRDYRKRMRWAVVLAVLLHAVLLFLPAQFRGDGPLFVPNVQDNEPVVISLQPRDDPKMLIDPGAPADSDTNPATDLISERASKAQDMTQGDDGGNVPDAGAIGPIDDIVSAPAPKPAPPAATPAPTKPAESVAPESKPDPTAAPRPETNKAPVPASAPVAKPMEKVEKAEPAIPSPQEQPTDAAIQVAKNDVPIPTPHTMSKTQSRVEGNAKSMGFLSFEAQQSQFAPYLRQVRDRVEQRWKSIMHVRYTGVSTAQAVLDCAIGPDGKLDKVAIVETGESATFASLCKQAIEQAGPFGPFPFEVPAMYQNKNIEIRWTFSFL
ncbi:MAG: TonB C-terminal domain-containing protein [Candidatus Hydrogenedentes bacterium]|nr:TonB C-terminal domain-containing protein [Candidatus Hydrogenedentota bacterium]